MRYGKHIAGLAASMMLLTGAVSAATAAKAKEDLGNDARTAVKRGLDYLAKTQEEAGNWKSKHKVSMTGLAVMAFLAAGHMPGQGEHGDVIKKGIDYVLTNQHPSGYYGKDGSRMYGHGITTLMLAEAMGMGVSEEQNKKIRTCFEKAIKVTIAAQQRKKHPNHAGGWRYEPHSSDSDLSLTVWQTMGLRAAKNCGVEIPKDSIEKAIKYIKRCKSHGGGFSYQPSRSRKTNHAMCGAGVLALQTCGEYECEEVKAGVQWITRNRSKWKGPFFYYGHYYLTQGMHQVGGREWEAFLRHLDAMLLPRQKKDGSFPFPPGSHGGSTSAGAVYSTSMSVLIVCARFKLLPIYQR